MPLSLETVSRIVGDIYSAAVDPSYLAPTLGQIAELAGVSAISLMDTTSDGRRVMRAFSGFDLSACEAYNGYFQAFDRALPVNSDTPFTFRRETIENIWPGYWKSEFANDWSRPNRIEGICFVTADTPHSRRALVLAGRPGERRLGDKGQIALLSILKPHIQRMSVLAARMRHLEHRDASFLDILERLPYGVILLDRQGRVAHATELAIDMIRSDNTLRLSARGLRAHDLATDRRLQRAITEALTTFDCKISDSFGDWMVTVTRATMIQPLILHVIPLRAGLGAPWLGDDAAMVLICDPARRGKMPSKILSQAFNLTPAEAEVAVQVATGQGLAAVAAKLDVSINTVRTHLQHVFEKTHARGQTELACLVAEFTFSLRLRQTE